MNQKIIKQLELMLKKLNLINKEIIKPEIFNNIKKLTNLLKEKSQLEIIVNLYVKYKNILNDINESKLILESEKNCKLIKFVKEELKKLELKKEKIKIKLETILFSKENNDNNKNVIFEIRGAAGGYEGNIFAGDLYRMYLKYAEQQNWKVNLIEANESCFGGFNIIVFMIKGESVYSKMKFESGAHRVQRIPKTENKGRIHTSIATVAVLPEIKEIDFKIKISDLKIDTYRASGAGGQHVNTTDSAVRITYLPTGVVVTSQDGRSQNDNKALAMKHLRSKLYKEQQQKNNKKQEILRKDAIGTGDRSQKIRTYNFPQNRVTDHRINLTIKKLDQIMDGKLDEIISLLINEEQKNKNGIN